MKDDKTIRPEIKLLRDIITDELKLEEDAKFKDMVLRKAENLYPLLSFFGTQNLDADEIRKKIKSLIEED
mgnify:CR=1 FL=1